MVTAAVSRKQAPDKILKLITSRRRRLNVEAPQIWAIRRAVAGVTHEIVCVQSCCVMCKGCVCSFRSRTPFMLALVARQAAGCSSTTTSNYMI